MLEKPMVMPFSEVLPDQMFYHDGALYSKTSDQIGSRVSNNVLINEKTFAGVEECSIAEKEKYIPLKARSELEHLASRIITLIGGKAIENCDIVNESFTWSPKFDESRELAPMKPLVDFTTYHSYGYYGFFKPSIAEVLAQIPEVLLQRVVAFEIVSQPETADDLNEQAEATNAGYHVATTRLFEAA